MTTYRSPALFSMIALAACTVFDGFTRPGDSSGLDPYAKAILASGPIAYYRLDDAPESTVAHDSSGNGHDCEYAGSIEHGVTGIVSDDSAVRFPTQGLGIKCDPSLFAFRGTQPFSVEGWYAPDAVNESYQSGFTRVTSGPRTGYTLFFHNAANPTIGFELYDNETLECYADGASFPCTEGVIDGSVTCGGFVQVVATFDGANVVIYANGTRAAAGMCAGIAVGQGDFTIGNYSPLSCDTCGLIGAVDEIAVYDRALSPTEVGSHYAAR